MKKAFSEISVWHNKKLCDEYQKNDLKKSVIFLSIGLLSVTASLFLFESIGWIHTFFLLSGILVGSNFEKIVFCKVNHISRQPKPVSTAEESHG